MCPHIADIVSEQARHPEHAFNVPILGIILVNAVVDGAFSTLGHYEMFCTANEDFPVKFNKTVCNAIAAVMPEAERLQHLCQATLDPFVCSTSLEFGEANIYKYLQEQEIDTGRRSPYDCQCGIVPVR